MTFMIVMIFTTFGCQKEKDVEHSLFDGEVTMVLPSTLNSWNEEKINNEFEGREKPKYVYSNDEGLQVDIVELSMTTEFITLKQLHDFRITRLKTLDSIVSIVDDGIVDLNSHNWSQITYYNNEKSYNVLFLITNVQSRFIYFRVIYDDAYKLTWLKNKDRILNSITFTE